MAALMGCSPIATSWPERMEFEVLSAEAVTEAPTDPAQLRVMTWNLKFGAGRIDFFFDGWGDRVHMSEAETLANMEAIADLLDEQQPDVLLAQEVDRASARSAYVDQAQWLLDETHFNYAAWVPIWEVSYIPESGLGAMEMGQLVYSRWPIVSNVRVDLPQSEASSDLVNLFWLRRAIQIVEIDIEGRPLTVLNNHPAAYALDGTKQKHLARIVAESLAVDSDIVVGGDLNVIPPYSKITDDFADNAASDTRGVSEVYYTEEEMASLWPLYLNYDPVVDLDAYAEADEDGQALHFTHSITQTVLWTQKLDYLFGDETWTSGGTLQAPGQGEPATSLDPMLLSDHAPVWGVRPW